MSIDDTPSEKDVPKAEKPLKEKKSKKKKASKKDPIADLQAQCDEYLAGWQRAQADYKNLQRETTTKIAQTIRHATEDFLEELLPMVDYFNYAFKGIPEEERGTGFLVGIEHIQKNFMRILEEHGVTLIDTTPGTPFNHELHEAVEEIEGEGKSGDIAEEVAAGFYLNDKVIRTAKVKVYK